MSKYKNTAHSFFTSWISNESVPISLFSLPCYRFVETIFKMKSETEDSC